MTTYDFEMPSLGADMDEGTITEWLVAAGDHVERGDVVAVVETDKADIDVEIWQAGVIDELVVPVGQLVAVGTTLARLTADADAGHDDGVGPAPVPVGSDDRPGTTDDPAAAPSPAAESSVDRAPPAQPSPEPVVARPWPTPVGAGERVPASPLARTLAAGRGIDLAAVAGSGPGGAIVARDLDGVPSGPGPAAPTRPSADERMRRAIAAAMTTSWREIPHYHLAADIDLESASVWLEGRNEGAGLSDRILPAALLLRASALALVEHPDLNGFWVDGGFVPGDGVNLGVAVSLRDGGLLTPTIHEADRLGLVDLMDALRDLVTRARSGRLRGSELVGSTITVTNLGDRGVRAVHGVIYPPQVALLGFGRIDRRAAVVETPDGGTEVVGRRMVTATLAADHRASDGQRGARLLNSLDRLLQTPETLT